MLRFAVEEEMITKLPFKIRMLKEVKRSSSKLFSREEIEKLLNAADERTRILLLIAFGTGMRFHEILHLQWQDVDSAQRRISVRAKDDWTPKTHHERECYVPQEVIDALETYRKSLTHRSPDDWIFQGRLHPGQRWVANTSRDAIRNTFKRAGLYQRGKLTHEIRRAVASTMLLNGTPIHVVKEILGHASIRTTELYAFSDEEAKREASRRGML